MALVEGTCSRCGGVEAGDVGIYTAVCGACIVDRFDDCAELELEEVCVRVAIEDYHGPD